VKGQAGRIRRWRRYSWSISEKWA